MGEAFNLKGKKMFKKYQHVEKFGNTEVQEIEFGECYIFPKIDGTNASAWIEDGEVCGGSRNRKLSLDKDNAGFLEWLLHQENIKSFLKDNPELRLYGEWLVPHSLKTYRMDSWRKFYVFDVCKVVEDELKYLHFEEYSKLLEEYNIGFIPPLVIVKNPQFDRLQTACEKNTYLIQENSGFGEGIVIKNYDFVNKYGRTCWAKVVTNEFKDKHIREMGANRINEKKMVEEEIALNFCTKSLCEKVKAKIENDRGDWKSQYIPQLLATVYYDIVREEIWTILKKYKNPTINFNTLKVFVNKRIRENLPEVF